MECRDLCEGSLTGPVAVRDGRGDRANEGAYCRQGVQAGATVHRRLGSPVDVQEGYDSMESPQSDARALDTGQVGPNVRKARLPASAGAFMKGNQAAHGRSQGIPGVQDVCVMLKGVLLAHGRRGLHRQHLSHVHGAELQLLRLLQQHFQHRAVAELFHHAVGKLQAVVRGLGETVPPMARGQALGGEEAVAQLLARIEEERREPAQLHGWALSQHLQDLLPRRQQVGAHAPLGQGVPGQHGHERLQRRVRPQQDLGRVQPTF
mmetsp:Transcript_17092/g.48132  ORF Transcript_17092/g.48132 Transcript_17092/m.48132 type:complete len:263 (-) Transcript_17092:109-897(-)